MQRLARGALAWCILHLLIVPASARAIALEPLLHLELQTYILSRLNESRETEDLPPLTPDPSINRISLEHCEDIATHLDVTSVETRERTFLGHTSSNGDALNKRFLRSNVPLGHAIAENVGYWTRNPFGELRDSSIFGIDMMLDGMMAEVPPNDAHRRTILGPYTNVGIGLCLLQRAAEGENAIFMVNDFAQYEERESASLETTKGNPFPPRSLLSSVVLPPSNQPFPDVLPDAPYAQAIQSLKERGLLSGYPDGNFYARRSVNRAELLKLLLTAKGFSPIGREYTACFQDVSNQWFAPYVCVSQRLGWVTGYPDQTFRPEQPITRAEAVTLLARIFELPVKLHALVPFDDAGESSWFYVPLQAVASHGFLPYPQGSFHPEKEMTRGEIAEMIERATR
jgi:uncharacterized protein YkwD